ncbi:MAG: glycosyltransferase [Deltaproteobacteria bacterium]|nr:glycosyltransferase [Deltaproteobacteria bacterium]
MRHGNSADHRAEASGAQVGAGRGSNAAQRSDVGAPRVSIGLPVDNGERYLEAAIQSILGQRFTDFELIISDNGSTDRTPEICQRCASRDARIRFTRSSTNRGAAWNFCHVFDLARGECFK